MKIRIDTDKKIISLDQSVNIEDLIKFLKKIFPKGEWKNYELEITTEINWNPEPIWIDPYIHRPLGPNPNIPFYEIGTPYEYLEEDTNSKIYDFEFNVRGEDK